jgi:hypothetical protein
MLAYCLCWPVLVSCCTVQRCEEEMRRLCTLLYFTLVYFTCSTQQGVGTPIRSQRKAHRGIAVHVLRMEFGGLQLHAVCAALHEFQLHEEYVYYTSPPFTATHVLHVIAPSAVQCLSCVETFRLLQVCSHCVCVAVAALLWLAGLVHPTTRYKRRLGFSFLFPAP